MKTDNLSRPGQPPQDGDLIRISYDNGATETKQYWTPPVIVAPPKPVKSGKEKEVEDLLLKLNWTPADTEAVLKLLLTKLYT